jgi:hypothetical protein
MAAHDAVVAPVPGATARRARVGSAALVVMVVIAVALAACGTKSSARPTTPATLQIISPAPHAVTGPTFDLRMALAHARVVSPSQAKGIDPSEGYIHVSVDGRLVGITYSLNEVVSHLSAGAHVLEAEFVATDHRPFANQVVATVDFTVR